MDTALYLLPVTLGDTPIESVLPSYNKEIIQGIKHFIVEDVRSARRFLKKVDREIDIDSLTFYLLNKHTSPEDISGYLKPTFTISYHFENEQTNRLVYLFIVDMEDDSILCDPRFKGGKLWTFQQIEHNLGTHFFSECFELEYEHLKQVIGIREKYKVS